MSRIIHLQGRDWTSPKASTSWQRERADPPLTSIEDELTGRYKLLSWTALAVVGSIFWTAVFCMALG